MNKIQYFSVKEEAHFLDHYVFSYSFANIHPFQ